MLFFWTFMNRDIKMYHGCNTDNDQICDPGAQNQS